MPDVVMKAIAANPQHNGYTAASTDKFGHRVVKAPKHNYEINISGIAIRYETRFDDVRYYSGDTPA